MAYQMVPPTIELFSKNYRGIYRTGRVLFSDLVLGSLSTGI